jgi:hypothetical protein
MTKAQKWFVLFTLAVLASVGTLAQLQQSGGGGSSVSGTNFPGTQAVSLATAPTTPVTGTFWQATQPVSLASAPTTPVTGTFWQTTQPISGTVTVNALPTGANVIGTVNTIPKTACGNTVASQALAAVPTSSTAVFASTTCVMQIVLNNTNSSAATVTVTDNAGTPINDVLTFSIPPNSQLIQPLAGIAFTTGVKWTASGTGVTGAMLGYQ